MRTMTQAPEFVARLVSAERGGCSVNGNPRWRLTFDPCHRVGNMDRLTSSDAMASYEVSNLLSWKGLLYVHTTRAGRVTNMRKVLDTCPQAQ